MKKNLAYLVVLVMAISVVSFGCKKQAEPIVEDDMMMDTVAGDEVMATDVDVDAEAPVADEVAAQ